MTTAALLALCAAVCAAVALVELTATAPRRRVRRRPFAVVWLAGVGRRLGAPRPAGDLAARIEAAGAPLGLGPKDLVAVKGGAAIMAPLAALPVALTLPGRLPVTMLLAAAAGGWLLPDRWLARRTRERARTLEAELPDVLDLLRVTVQAGLPSGRALAEVGRRHPGLLAAEIARSAGECEFGVPRREALDGLSRRACIAGVRALVIAIGRADRHGVPLAGALTALATQARADRARAVREAAARAAPQVQLAVAALLVPGAMLLLAAALLGTLTD